MVRMLLVRGMLAGIVAGLLSFGFLKVYGEPQVDRAIAFETQMDDAKAETDKTAGMHSQSMNTWPERKKPSRSAGRCRPVSGCLSPSWFTAPRSAGFSVWHSRLPMAAYPAHSRPQALSALLAATGFVAIYLVPNLKYPANPPAVGDHDTIGERTALYFVMIAISLAAMVGSAALARILGAQLTKWNANLAVTGSYILIVVVAALAMPTVNEVPEHFPAVLLWQFRLASIGAQFIMWATLGLLFGALVGRASAGGRLLQT